MLSNATLDAASCNQSTAAAVFLDRIVPWSLGLGTSADSTWNAMDRQDSDLSGSAPLHALVPFNWELETFLVRPNGSGSRNRNSTVYVPTMSSCLAHQAAIPYRIAKVDNQSETGDARRAISCNSEQSFRSDAVVSEQCSRGEAAIDALTFRQELLARMDDEDYISGETSLSELFVEDIMQIHGEDWTMMQLSQLCQQDDVSPHTLIGILHMISHFPYETVYSYGPSIAQKALEHENEDVRDFAIKAFENWEDKAHLPVLKKVKYKEEWLQKYLDAVIADFENDRMG